MLNTHDNQHAKFKSYDYLRKTCVVFLLKKLYALTQDMDYTDIGIHNDER